MIFEPASLAGAFIIHPEPFQDHRGAFARIFCMKEFSAIAHDLPFVQINHSHTNKKATIRGLHYQLPPSAEVKLIHCIRGRVYDVIVDIRQNSPTFLQHFGLELTEDNRKMIYVPKGFAHGFQTLEDNCQLMYYHTAYYAPSSEGGLRFDDPLLNISWPLAPTNLSSKDQSIPYLTPDFAGVFLHHD